MNERPILFSAPMVRAILAGTKVQTRRVLKPQPPAGTEWVQAWHHPDEDRRGPHFYAGADRALTDFSLPCPYGKPGDRLWVREAFMHEPADYCWEASVSIPCRPATTVYRADYPESMPGEGWKPSIHMPRALSRITLEITGVRVERLQDISEADAIAEGIEAEGDEWRDYLMPHTQCCLTPRNSYRTLWEQINGAGSWDANPWVWVVEFKRV